MTRKIVIGAPSLTGEAASKLVRAAFDGASYPLEVVITNHMPRQVAFPEIGLFLAPFTGKGTVTLANSAALHRFASTVEQIAQLNRYEKAVTIEAPEPAMPEKTADAGTVAKTPKEGADQPAEPTAKPVGKAKKSAE